MKYRKGDFFTVSCVTLYGDTKELGYLCVLKDFDLDTEWKWFKENTGPGAYAGDWPFCAVFLDHLIEQDFLGVPPPNSPRIHTFWAGYDPKISHSTSIKLVRFDD